MEDSNMNAEATVDGGSTTESSSKAAHPPRDERIQKLLDKALYAGGRNHRGRSYRMSLVIHAHTRETLLVGCGGGYFYL